MSDDPVETDTYRVYGVYVVGLEAEVEATSDEFAREHAEEALLQEAKRLGIDPGEAEGHVSADDVVNVSEADEGVRA